MVTRSCFWDRSDIRTDLPGDYHDGRSHVIAVARPTHEVVAVLHADLFESRVHMYIDIWLAGQQVASTDTAEEWPMVEKWVPKQHWPPACFAWVGDTSPILPEVVQLERAASWLTSLAGLAVS